MSLLSFLSILTYGQSTPVFPDPTNGLRKKVKAGGTAGVDCDYTSITAAIAAITDAAIGKQYILEIFNGHYDEAGPNGTGLILKDYVHLIGQSRDGVIIKGPEQTTGNEVIADTIHAPATSLVRNLTLHAYKVKYCVHSDNNSILFNCIFDSVKMQHFGGSDGYLDDVGYGLYGGQSLSFINCEFYGRGVFGHGNIDSPRDLTKRFQLMLLGCKMANFIYYDFIEYADNRIILAANEIGRLIMNGYDSTYTANSTDPTMNRGYKIYTAIEQHNNIIGEMAMDTNPNTNAADGTSSALSILGKIPSFENFNERVYNTNASTISKGYAVKLLADGTIPNSYADTENIYHKKIDLYNGSGVPFGFAMEDMATVTTGMVQQRGTPQAYFNNTGGSVVYGDALELNASGQVQKKSTGDTVGYALAGASASGLLKIKMK